jgi:hypothetical protein
MLRSLDAILVLDGGRFTALGSYDKRLLAAATAIGLPVASPGAA